MHRRPILLFASAVLIGLGVLAGCARPRVAAPPEPIPAPVPAPTPTPAPAPAPPASADWTQWSSGAHPGGSGKAFLGIGKASGLRSATLLRASADNQAQSEITRVVALYLDALSRSAGLDPELQQDRETINALAAAVLRRARVSDHRYEEPRGLLFSLCTLELSALKEVLQKFEALDEPLRRKMLGLSDQVYTDLAAGKRTAP